MPSFSGKHQYLDSKGTALQSGPCRLSFEAETLTLSPVSGPPLAIDLGDIDIFLPGDYELALTLYDGKRVILNQFGKTFQNLCHDLLEAYRLRLIQCLLLEDLEEIVRFEGFAHLESPARAFSSPAEFRLYKSNLAILPAQATGLQWRLADIDRVQFDQAGYCVTVEANGERLLVTKLAKRTEEFRDRLTQAGLELAEQGARALHNLFPFLTPDQFTAAAKLMKEGRAAPLAGLRAIHPKTEQALATNVVDAAQKPYFDALLAHAAGGNYYAGFKLLREEEQRDTEEASAETPAPPSEDDAGTGGEPTPEPSGPSIQEEGAAPILYWFFFPLAVQSGVKSPGNLVAWEATSRSGRATYFFRLLPSGQAGLLKDPSRGPAAVEAAIRDLNRAIVLLNFRREPIYLPDDSLAIQPRFHRYAIACRKLPELVRLRSSFLGRAIHTTPKAWQKQFETFLAKA